VAGRRLTATASTRDGLKSGLGGGRGAVRAGAAPQTDGRVGQSPRHVRPRPFEPMSPPSSQHRRGPCPPYAVRPARGCVRLPSLSCACRCAPVRRSRAVPAALPRKPLRPLAVVSRPPTTANGGDPLALDRFAARREGSSMPAGDLAAHAARACSATSQPGQLLVLPPPERARCGPCLCEVQQHLRRAALPYLLAQRRRPGRWLGASNDGAQGLPVLAVLPRGRALPLPLHAGEPAPTASASSAASTTTAPTARCCRPRSRPLLPLTERELLRARFA